MVLHFASRIARFDFFYCKDNGKDTVPCLPAGDVEKKGTVDVDAQGRPPPQCWQQSVPTDLCVPATAWAGGCLPGSDWSE